MKILSFAKWIPVGLAATLGINIAIVAITQQKLLVPWWLILSCAVAIALFGWDSEKDCKILDRYYGISWPLQLLYLSGAAVVAAIAFALLG